MYTSSTASSSSWLPNTVMFAGNLSRAETRWQFFSTRIKEGLSDRIGNYNCTDRNLTGRHTDNRQTSQHVNEEKGGPSFSHLTLYASLIWSWPGSGARITTDNGIGALEDNTIFLWLVPSKILIKVIEYCTYHVQSMLSTSENSALTTEEIKQWVGCCFCPGWSSYPFGSHLFINSGIVS